MFLIIRISDIVDKTNYILYKNIRKSKNFIISLNFCIFLFGKHTSFEIMYNRGKLDVHGIEDIDFDTFLFHNSIIYTYFRQIYLI